MVDYGSAHRSHYFPRPVRAIRIIIDRFYIALFSALEQTHCAHVTSLNTHRSGVFTALFGCYTAGAK